MMRNRGFHHLHEPFRSQDSVQLDKNYIDGPISFLNPTRAHIKHTTLVRSSSDNKQEALASRNHPDVRKDQTDIESKWRSRDNRKGRHALLVEPRALVAADHVGPQPTSTLPETLRGIIRMVTQCPYWDVSYLVATIFTLGSVVWVINGFFAYLPLAQPQTEFDTEILYGGGITAFIGATIFEIGSVLLMFEAVNENRTGCFGWAVERLVEGDREKSAKIWVRPDKDGCRHHHTNKRNLLGRGDAKPSTSSFVTTSSPSSLSLNGFKPSQSEQPQYDKDKYRSWVWFPSVQELKSHYVHELGFLACLAQLIGASVFWISGFTALPGINNKLGSQGLLDGIFWAPQIVGGTGFIISGTLFMLETQSKWYKPAFDVLGWHIGFWNLVGAFGFTLCGALGPAYGNSGAEYEASLATFWGSWAFLIGSLIQWYESLDKYPVEPKDGGGTPEQV